MIGQGLRVGLCLLLLWTGSAGAVELTPPFGLSWGGNPGRLSQWAQKFELDLLVKSPGKEPEMSILLISSETGTLPGHEASMLEARFIDGRLFEVSVHYTYPGRHADFVQKRFLELKKQLGVKYGEFRLSGRQKAVKDGVSTTSDAYHLEPSPGNLLMLARTEVEDAQRGDLARKFSVIYHCDRILREHEKRASSVWTEGDEPIRLPERK